MIRTPGLIITALVTMYLLLPASICDAARVYLTRDM